MSAITWRRGHRRRRPYLEWLEGRLAPATFTVTSGGDSPAGAGSAASGALRYCIAQANLSADPAGDTIVFAPAVTSVALTEGTLLISAANPLTIQGLPGSTTISGSSSFGIFKVAPSSSVSF